MKDSNINAKSPNAKSVGLLVSCWGSEGGVIRVASELANRMADDYRVHLIELHGEGKGCAYRIDERVHTKTLLRGDEFRLSDYLRDARGPLSRYLKEEDIDVLLLMGTYPGVMGIIPWLARKTKVVFCDHGAIANQLEDRQLTLIRFMSSLFCARTITLTERNREDYKRLLHVPRRKVQVIPNWIPNRLLDRESDYDISSHSAIWVGRLDAEKGLDQLIDIVTLAKDEIRSLGWHIDVFGSAVLGESTDVASELKNRSVDDLIILRGSVSDIYERYSSYGLYLLTSYREGLPLALLESQACGVPGIAFDVVTGPSEIIENEVNGLLIEPRNCEEFAKAMVRTMKNKDDRCRMASYARNKASMFREDRVYSQWCLLINDLAGEL